MSLNDIQLPGSVLASLYPHSLVQTGEITTSELPMVETGEDLPTWKFLGDNQRHILIVVNYPDSPYLPDDELDFLTKMLTACRLSIGDTAIVNAAHHPGFTAKDYLGQFHSKIVFLFGIDPVSFGLPVSFPAYQVQSVANITYMHTPALEERHQDELLKSKLWVSLKRIFGI